MINRVLVAAVIAACSVLISIVPGTTSGAMPSPSTSQPAGRSKDRPLHSLGAVVSPTPTTTPMPTLPPIVPPRDAPGTARTSPPFEPPSPHPEPTVPPALWLTTAEATTVHCEIHDGRVFVPVVAGGRHLTFLLDSTASSAIDTSLAPNAEGPTVALRTLQIGALRLKDVAADRLPIKPYAETYIGASADGIVGKELFWGYPVAIDYEGATVTVYRTSAAAAAARPGDALILPLRVINGLPFVAARIDGKFNRMLALTTGSGTQMTLDARSATSQRMVRANTGLADFRSADPSGETRGKTVRLNNVGIGSLNISRPLAGLISAPLTDETSTADGIGGALLSQFEFVLIDEPGNSLTLQMHGANMSVQDYDRSGAWLIKRGDSIVIRSVLHPSPAAAAGLAGGDEILAFDNQAPTDLDAARAQFARPAGTKIGITYRRFGKERRAAVTLRTLL